MTMTGRPYRFRVTWADLDWSYRLAEQGYLEYAARTRLSYFRERGVTPILLSGQALCPVLCDETLRCRSRLRLSELFFVDLTLGGLSLDASRFLIVHRFCTADGQVCAELFGRGAWMDLVRRRPVPPPPRIARAMEALRREPAFEIL